MDPEELEKIATKIRTNLDSKDKVREWVLSRAREVIRASGFAVSAIHRGEYDRAKDLISESIKRLDDIQTIEPEHPDIYYSGFVQDAQKEYAESVITLALVKGTKLPHPDKLKIGYAPYLCGLGEAMGELRRHILDIIREDKIERAEELLKTMDNIYYTLTSFSYPDAITGGLRRITDIARSVIERTRGDLTTVIRQRALEAALKRLEDKLKKAK